MTHPTTRHSLTNPPQDNDLSETVVRQRWGLLRDAGGRLSVGDVAAELGLPMDRHDDIVHAFTAGGCATYDPATDTVAATVSDDLAPCVPGLPWRLGNGVPGVLYRPLRGEERLERALAWAREYGVNSPTDEDVTFLAARVYRTVRVKERRAIGALLSTGGPLTDKAVKELASLRYNSRRNMIQHRQGLTVDPSSADVRKGWSA